MIVVVVVVVFVVVGALFLLILDDLDDLLAIWRADKIAREARPDLSRRFRTPGGGGASAAAGLGDDVPAAFPRGSRLEKEDR